MDLTDKEQKAFEVITKVVNNELTRKEAEFELRITRQQVYRLIKIYNDDGKKGFVHKNRGKKSLKKKERQLIEELESLYLSEYYDYNFEAFYDELKDKYNYDISYDVILKEFKKDDIISPLAHKKTVKLYKERVGEAIKNNEEIQEEKLDLFKSRQIAYNQAHTRRANNMLGFGQEIQMDACEKIWFGNIVTYLHLGLDKATKKVLFGWFEYEEITRGYFILLFNIIINYGIPSKIKTDNRNSFSNQKGDVDTTQFGRICNMLNIELITTSVSTAKANIERENKTFKDRLIAELRHEGITEIDGANKYVNEVFIPKMNKKFSYEINYKTSKMRPNNYSLEELNLIISEKYTRIIDNASSIKYNNKYYIPLDSTTGEIVCFMKKTECKFIISYDLEYWCEIESNYYKLMELKDRDSIMRREIKNDKPIEKGKYIPPKEHPWRKFKVK